MLIDAHCHAYELSENDLEKFSEIRIIAVSEDLESSLRNLEISRRFRNITPFAGIHPLNSLDFSEEELDTILDLASRKLVKGFGEVGIDGRCGIAFEKQENLFKTFCSMASELDLPINVHALDSWKAVLDTAIKLDVGRALIHWYNGPMNLLKLIRECGYYISINPAITVQPKHRMILEKAELEIILTESDGPYRYRGLFLTPGMMRDLVKMISEIKEVDVKEVEKAIQKNYERFLG